MSASRSPARTGSTTRWAIQFDWSPSDQSVKRVVKTDRRYRITVYTYVYSSLRAYGDLLLNRLHAILDSHVMISLANQTVVGLVANCAYGTLWNSLESAFYTYPTSLTPVLSPKTAKLTVRLADVGDPDRVNDGARRLPRRSRGEAVPRSEIFLPLTNKQGRHLV